MAASLRHVRTTVIIASLQNQTIQVVRCFSMSSVLTTKSYKRTLKLPLEVTPEYLERRRKDKEYPNLWQSKKTTATLDSLKARGFYGHQKPYSPPENTEASLLAFSKELFGSHLEENWQNTSLINSLLKYKLLTRCESHFNWPIPNSLLYTIRKVGDVVEFYSTPVEGLMPYDKLVQEQASLPPNLYVIPNPVRFHPEIDTMFGGVTAYPGSSTFVTGLKTRKKYRGHKAVFKWPNV